MGKWDTSSLLYASGDSTVLCGEFGPPTASPFGHGCTLGGCPAGTHQCATESRISATKKVSAAMQSNIPGKTLVDFTIFFEPNGIFLSVASRGARARVPAFALSLRAWISGKDNERLLQVLSKQLLLNICEQQNEPHHSLRIFQIGPLPRTTACISVRAHRYIRVSEGSRQNFLAKLVDS